MKKLATLILAAGLVFGATTGANAIDFKAKGQWLMQFDYGQHGNFMGKNANGKRVTGWGKGSQDDFEASQRVRLQLDAVASESLSGSVWFEIGRQWWGKTSNGGALGADGIQVKVKGAWLDWMIPETEAKVRMGIQHVTLPSFTLGGSTVLDDDVAGVVVSAPINENIGVTAMWLRPYNDNYTNEDNSRLNSYMDNMDLGALLVPMTFDGAKVTPWGMYGAIGPNTWRSVVKDTNKDGTYKIKGYKDNGDPIYEYKTTTFNSSLVGSATPQFLSGILPVGGARHRDFSNASSARKLSTYGNAWWGGITGDITMWDPFRFAFDFTYGSITWDDDGRLNRQGWLASLLFEYKMDWGIPGIVAWYGSGDDSNPANGSERMPTLSDNNSNGFSNFAFSGNSGIVRDGLISDGQMGGTWGVGARVRDMSFIEKLTHTFKINLIGGTNSPTMAKKMSLAGFWANGQNIGDGVNPYWNADSKQGDMNSTIRGMYLTTEDYALEFSLTNRYKMYENFTVELEADYIAMWLDTSKSVWGARHKYGKSIPQTNDAWNISASFAYSF